MIGVRENGLTFTSINATNDYIFLMELCGHITLFKSIHCHVGLTIFHIVFPDTPTLYLNVGNTREHYVKYCYEHEIMVSGFNEGFFLTVLMVFSIPYHELNNVTYLIICEHMYKLP